VPNLQVIKLMQSFKSKEYVKESFAWRHYYWYRHEPLSASSEAASRHHVDPQEEPH